MPTGSSSDRFEFRISQRSPTHAEQKLFVRTASCTREESPEGIGVMPRRLPRVFGPSAVSEFDVVVEEISEDAVIEAISTAAVTESNEEQGLSNEMRAKIRREISPCMGKMMREQGKFNPPEELAASLAAIGGARKDWANEFNTMLDTKTKWLLGCPYTRVLFVHPGVKPSAKRSSSPTSPFLVKPS